MEQCIPFQTHENELLFEFCYVTIAAYSLFYGSGVIFFILPGT